MWFLDVGDDVAAHLAVALKRHRQWAAKTSMRLPPEVAQLQAACESRVREGQGGSRVAALWDLVNAPIMPVQLLTYETAADSLAVSLSTLKRLVSNGELRSVHVGRSPRIRVADLEAYVADLAVDEQSGERAERTLELAGRS